MPVNKATSSHLALPNVDDKAKRMGDVRSITGVLTFAATSDIGSTGKIEGIPWDAIIQPKLTGHEVSNFGASVTVNVGVGGPTNPTNNLAATLALSAAAFQDGQAWGLHAAAKHGKRLWELAGYTKSPGGMADITYTLAGANSAAGGTIAFSFVYAI